MEYKVSDSVWHRVVQIIQESMLMGVDCADLLRQVRLTIDDSNTNTLTLSSSYRKQVEEMHVKYLSELESKKTEKTVLLTDD